MENKKTNHRRSVSLSHWNTQTLTPMEKETELKNTLDELIQTIDDTGFIDHVTIGKLFIAIFALKAERNKIPKEFRCPISKTLMSDPVVVASGQTYDRSALTNWAKTRKKTRSPRTKKVLSHEAIMSSHLVRSLILKWCKTHGVPEPVQHPVEEQLTKSDDDIILTKLLNKMFIDEEPMLQKLAAKELLRLTRERPAFQALYAKYPKVILRILQVLPPPVLPPPESDYEIDPQLHEYMITILLSISADERNRGAVSTCPITIPVLIQAFKAKRLEIRCTAAATIYQLSFLYRNKEKIGKSGVFKPLLELLKEKWSPQATQDATNAILNLLENKTNVARAVRYGAVPVVAEKMKDKTVVDEMLFMLRQFSVYNKTLEELEKLGCIPELFSIVRENPSDVSKENAIWILHSIFQNNCRLWVDMAKEVEKNREFITCVSQTGTPKAKIKASAILESFNKEKATSSSITRPGVHDP